ncbi:MAG: hypothetical protein RL120_17020, partial [Gammaproteobacteria bacterium]
MKPVHKIATCMSLLALFVSSQLFAEPSVRQDVVYGHKDGMALIYDVVRPVYPNGAAIVFMVIGGLYSRWAHAANWAQRFPGELAACFTVIHVYNGRATR